MRLHHEDLTFFLLGSFLLVDAEPEHAPAGHTGTRGESLPRQRSSCEGELGDPGHNHVL